MGRRQKRWGAGTHSVFLRDISQDQRNRKSEDTYVPKKGKIVETPIKGGEKKRTRLDTSRRTPTDSRDEELARSAAKRQTEKVERQKYKDDLIDKIREKQLVQKALRDNQLEARMSKMAHPSSQSGLTTNQIAKFTAINENWTPENPKTREKTDESGSEVCVGTMAGAEEESDEADEAQKDTTSESDPELLRGEVFEEEHELEPAFESSEHEDYETREYSPSPERDVTFTPEKPISKTARKNSRRRRNQKIYKDKEHYEETKKRIGLKRRIGRDTKNPHLRLGPVAKNERRPPTTSTEILSDSDERAGRRPDGGQEKKKRRRESQESVEEIDSQGRKMSRAINKYQRN